MVCGQLPAYVDRFALQNVMSMQGTILSFNPAGWKRFGSFSFGVGIATAESLARRVEVPFLTPFAVGKHGLATILAQFKVNQIIFQRKHGIWRQPWTGQTDCRSLRAWGHKVGDNSQSPQPQRSGKSMLPSSDARVSAESE